MDSLWITTIISAVVTILGFLFTYNSMKKNFKSEIEKVKIDKTLDKISDLPMEIQQLMDDTLNNKITNEEYANRFRPMMAKIFAYCSKSTITIATNMQEFAYNMSNAKEKNEEDNYKSTAYFVLLICQIKYDITGTEINPEYWYRMRFPKYNEIKEKQRKANNDIVNQLDIQKFLLTKK